MTNRYTMDAQDIYDEDLPLRDTDIVDRLNEQDDDIERLRTERATLVAAADTARLEMIRFGNLLNWPIETPQSYADAINGLRDVLAEATR